MKSQLIPRATLYGLAMAAVFALSGCQRAEDNRTAGQKLDAALAKTGEKAAEVKQDVKQAGRDAAQVMSKATEGVVNASRDAGITASVKTRLAGDPGLSTMAINVDTSGGRVVLRGSAPDTAARNRATALTRSVDGVGDVTNELNVQAKP